MSDSNSRATQPTIELHVPVALSAAQKSKLLDGLCSLVTRHDVPIERVRIVATGDTPAATSAGTAPAGRMRHKPAVQKVMDLARRFRSAPGDLYDDAYKAVESAAYEALERVQSAGEAAAPDTFAGWYQRHVGISLQEAQRRGVYDLETLEACWSAASAARKDDDLQDLPSLCWNAHRVWGDPATIAAVKQALHDAGTIEDLKRRLSHAEQKLTGGGG